MAVGGFNVDEMKRQQQFMQMQAEQKLSSQQKMDFDSYKTKRKHPKDAVVTVCVVAALALVVFLLARNGIL